MAFVHIPKTAGTTLTSILLRTFGTKHFDRPNVNRVLTARVLRNFSRVYRNLYRIGYHYVRPYSNLMQKDTGLRYYTFLREPRARLLLHCRYHLWEKTRSGSFETRFQQHFRQFIQWKANIQAAFLSAEKNTALAIGVLTNSVSFLGLLETGPTPERQPL